MFTIGIDLGGTNIAAGLVDAAGNLVCKKSVPTLRDRDHTDIIKDMAMLSFKVAEEAGVDMKQIHSIGIGSPGTPDIPRGIIVYANNLNFRNVPMAAEMNKYIQLPVHIDNDANCAALAESRAGAAKGHKHSVTITIGTGIGSGVIIDGRIYSGFNNAAAEMGHMVILSGGELCTCGRLGCWEAYASATALIRQTRQAAMVDSHSKINNLVEGNLDRVDAKTAFDAARIGDETGKQVVDQFIFYLADGVVNLINIFQPEVLVVGGGVCKEGETLLGPLRELVRKSAYTREEVPQTQIRVAQLGNDAGIVGAALLGRQTE
ncbi:MAG TPA: glucokinase [Clostridiales bacterium]|nr:glucokinase [Clostridiales bacterium]